MPVERAVVGATGGMPGSLLAGADATWALGAHADRQMTLASTTRQGRTGRVYLRDAVFGRAVVHSTSGLPMRIVLVSLFVANQEHALAFYTSVLGFVKKRDIPAGDFRWLTVVSPDAPDGVELSLEPNENPAAQVYQRALFEAGIPATSFAVDDVEAEHARLVSLGVGFRVPPTNAGETVIAVFDDTCGNLIQIHRA